MHPQSWHLCILIMRVILPFVRGPCQACDSSVVDKWGMNFPPPLPVSALAELRAVLLGEIEQLVPRGGQRLEPVAHLVEATLDASELRVNLALLLQHHRAEELLPQLRGSQDLALATRATLAGLGGGLVRSVGESLAHAIIIPSQTTQGDALTHNPKKKIRLL